MEMHRCTSPSLLLALSLLISGCSSLLPHSQNESITFQNFDEARQAVESLVPMQSNVTQLASLGIDPVKLPNTLILSYPDLLRRFTPGNVSRKSELDPGIEHCLNSRDTCRGWELKVERINRQRTGSFLPDFLNFSRRTVSTGWRFNALILMVNGVVVYRSWGGQPVLNAVDIQKNPLGPLQNIGAALITEF